MAKTTGGGSSDNELFLCSQPIAPVEGPENSGRDQSPSPAFDGCNFNLEPTMKGTWIKLWRPILDSDVWQADLGIRVAWIQCLLLANHKPGMAFVDRLSEPVPVDTGQFVTGRFSFHAKMFPKKRRSNPSDKTVWRWLESLEKLGNLVIKTTNKYSLITIVNWGSYQNGVCEGVQVNDQVVTSKRPGSDQVVTTNKKVKNEENVENEKKKEYSAPDGAGPEPEFYITKKKRKLSGKRLETFNIFWKKFNYPKGKAEAADSWLDIPQLTDSLVKTIYAAAEKEARARPDLIKNGGSPKWAQGWITSKRWEDGEPIATGSPEAEAAEANETERKRQELLKHYDRITAEKERQATAAVPGSGTGVVRSTLFGPEGDSGGPGNGDGSE